MPLGRKKSDAIYYMTSKDSAGDDVSFPLIESQVEKDLGVYIDSKSSYDLRNMCLSVPQKQTE